MTTALDRICSEKARACASPVSDQPKLAGATCSHSVPGKRSSAFAESNRNKLPNRTKTKIRWRPFIESTRGKAAVGGYHSLRSPPCRTTVGTLLFAMAPAGGSQGPVKFRPRLSPTQDARRSGMELPVAAYQACRGLGRWKPGLRQLPPPRDGGAPFKTFR